MTNPSTVTLDLQRPIRRSNAIAVLSVKLWNLSPTEARKGKRKHVVTKFTLPRIALVLPLEIISHDLHLTPYL